MKHHIVVYHHQSPFTKSHLGRDSKTCVFRLKDNFSFAVPRPVVTEREYEAKRRSCLLSFGRHRAPAVDIKVQEEPQTLKMQVTFVRRRPSNCTLARSLATQPPSLSIDQRDTDTPWRKSPVERLPPNPTRFAAYPYADKN